MSELENYHTPRELQKLNNDVATIEKILAVATENGASVLASMLLNEPRKTVDVWTDKIWDGLRDSLTGEQLIHAVIILLTPEAERRARDMVGEVT